MAQSLQSTDKLFALWRVLKDLPFGKRIFSVILGWVVPYSGTLAANIKEINAGFVSVELIERWRLRNHLGSIHAMALANICELGSGLALLSKLTPEYRAILVGFEVRYLKKARGKISVECDLRDLRIPLDTELFVPVSARDKDGEIVVTAKAHWRIGRKNLGPE